MKDFYGQKVAGTRKYTRLKSRVVMERLLSFRGWWGQNNYLTSTDHVIPNL